MFTNDTQAVIDRAKDVSASRGENQLTNSALATSLAIDPHGARFLSQCLAMDQAELRRRFPAPDPLQTCTGKLTLAPEVREMLALAKTFVAKLPSPKHPSLIALSHLAAAVARSLPAAQHTGIKPPSEERVLQLLAGWMEEETRPPSLGDLTRRLRALRNELLQRVYGQEHAIHQFVQGLFNIEAVGDTDTERRKPAGLFVFAGPPGVGKTFLAELGASHLDRPFMRFDMSAYAHGHEAVGLTGIPRMYQGAKPGPLTEFVQRNPNAVLLFDEIEKSHITTIHLFLQMLDAGRLQDKFTEQNVEFRDTIIIFTTNAGRSLYENQNAFGVHQANAAFHRNTVLDALRSELDPRTREPLFPAALCSRLATGTPVLFNHLQVEDLARIAGAELHRIGGLMERRHGQHYAVAEEIPLAIVMREGASADARTIKAQAEALLKEEVFKACQLLADEHVDPTLAGLEEVRVEVDEEHAGEIAVRLFWEKLRPSVLFAGEELLGRVYAQAIPEVEWLVASNADRVFDVLTKRSVDFVMLDLALRSPASTPYADLRQAFSDVSKSLTANKTVLNFDYSPPAARQYAVGQKLLEGLRQRMPEIPVYLFSLAEEALGLEPKGIGEELLIACVRAGGARGVIRTALGSQPMAEVPRQCDALRSELERITLRLRRERTAAELARHNQVVTFDTAPVLEQDKKRLRVRCRNFRLVRAVRSADASALITDAERPSTGFGDVIGAAGAKEALGFIRDWLRDPKKYAAAGIDPPRGVLLTGPPGTGKTLLARALAGESDCAFLVEAASNFVTLWQGSGPENVRNLFARAQRYAPSIVFIDEIDAIGKTRTGIAGAGRAQEETLNALLTEIDGFSKSPSCPVIVIAATNHPELLDPALLRRFNRVIEVELPTRAERELYLRTRLEAKTKHAVSPAMVERLAAQSAGMSIANLENILAEAAIMALANEGIIDDAILGEAFEKVTLGEAKAGSDPLRTARHEAGHALIMCLTGVPPIYVTIVGRGAFGGYAAFEDRDERRSQTRPELDDRICQVLGGREAERLYYGDAHGDSTGPSNDLERATAIAEAMVYEFGMAEEIGFVRIDRGRPLAGELADRCHQAVRRIIDAQCERTQGLLAEHRATLDRIVAALLERNRLLKHELLDLLAPEEKQLAKGSGP